MTLKFRRGDCAIASSALRNRLTSTCWIWTRSTSTRSRCGSRLNRKLHALLAGAGETERAGLLDQLGKTFDALLGFAARDEIAKPADDLPGADRLLGSAVQRAFDFRRCWDRRCRQQPARALHVVADRGERLIELVRKRRRHLSHRAQARDVDQFGLQLLQPCLGLLMLGEVADEAGK